MISYATTLLAITAGTLIPAYLALYIIPRLRPVQTAVLAAAGVGLTFWFFFDTMGDASQLDVNSAIYPFSSFGGATHFAVIAAFLGGIAALAIIDHFGVLDSKFEDGHPAISGTKSKTLILVPISCGCGNGNPRFRGGMGFCFGVFGCDDRKTWSMLLEGGTP